MKHTDEPQSGPPDRDSVDDTDDSFDLTPEEDDLLFQAWKQVQEGRFVTEEELWASLPATG